MDRRKLIQSFARHRFNEQAFVAYPDHPLLSRGPDLLASNDSGLVAAFMYSSPWSRPASPSEQSRILLSRLALPENTAFWLIISNNKLPVSTNDYALFDVATTLMDEEGETSNDISVDEDFRHVLPVLKRFNSERFAAAWAPPKKLNSIDIKKPGFPTSRVHSNRHKSFASWIDLSVDGSLSAEIDEEHGRTQLISRVRSFSTAATSLDYGIGNGISPLFQTAKLLENGDAYLSLHRADIKQNWRPEGATTNDLLKPFRTAAFAGAAVKYPALG
ncbi:hypothetical protein [Arthrobacter ruber]|uniref:hypothetical protein n=1 Tax=Arthrobacter ruber TaxID=1258893 RepID=UPI0012FFE86C|nr:hypothetical protein [Arthrobacter ruber]